MIIRFRGEIETVHNMDGTYDRIRVPEPVLDALRRLQREVLGGDYLRLDRVPPAVEVETSGGLADVTIHV